MAMFTSKSKIINKRVAPPQSIGDPITQPLYGTPSVPAPMQSYQASDMSYMQPTYQPAVQPQQQMYGGMMPQPQQLYDHKWDVDLNH